MRVPESCETCQYYKGCIKKIDVILAGNECCTNYRMSDECQLCIVCPDQKCINFGSCLPVQEVLF